MVKSVERAIQICELLGEGGALSLAQIARRIQAPKTTVYEILATLESQRLVLRDDVAGTFNLGMRLISLGQLAQRGFELRRVVLPFLQQLNRELDETVHLTVLEEDHVLYVECVESSKRLRTYSVIGIRGPLYCTAVGKAILAYLPPAERRSLVERMQFETFTPNTIVSRESLESDLHAISARGYSIDDEEHEPGVRCVGAPIFDARGRVVASISVSGPTQRVTREAVPGLAERVTAVTDQISRQLTSTGRVGAALVPSRTAAGHE